MAPAIDTIEYARHLREAGLTEQLAEGHAQALSAAMTDSLATKPDLRDLETRMGARFDAMDAKFEGRFEALDTKFEGRMDAMRAEMQGRLAAMDARFDGVHNSIIELEKRLDLRLSERLADLERRMTVRLLAGIAAVSALTRVL